MSGMLAGQLKKRSQQIPAPAVVQESEHRSMPPQNAGHSAPASGGHALSRMQLHSDSLAAPTAQSCSKGYTKPSHCPFGGACHTCPSVVQAKLTVSQPGDKYEEEADRTAERVMRMAAPGGDGEYGDLIGTQTPVIQRACPLCDEDDEIRRQPVDEVEHQGDGILQAKPASGGGLAISPALESQINSIRGGGQPLEPTTRAFMEARFGRDFGQVRVHTDAKAAEATAAVRARAFTVGRDVVFGAGHYVHHSDAGRHLLAHELAHYVQQTQPPIAGRPVRGAARAEGGTDLNRHHVSRRPVISRLSSSSAVLLQRDPAGGCGICVDAKTAGTHAHVLAEGLFMATYGRRVIAEQPFLNPADEDNGRLDLLSITESQSPPVTMIEIGEIKPDNDRGRKTGKKDLEWYRTQLRMSFPAPRFSVGFMDLPAPTAIAPFKDPVGMTCPIQNLTVRGTKLGGQKGLYLYGCTPPARQIPKSCCYPPPVPVPKPETAEEKKTVDQKTHPPVPVPVPVPGPGVEPVPVPSPAREPIFAPPQPEYPIPARPGPARDWESFFPKALLAVLSAAAVAAIIACFASGACEVAAIVAAAGGAAAALIIAILRSAGVDVQDTPGGHSA